MPLGIANAALEQKNVEEQNAAAQLCLQHILDAKLADASAAYKKRADALNTAIDRHQASLERILSANPDRYADVNTAAVMGTAVHILASLAIKAEVDADLTYDVQAQTRADKKLAFQAKEKSDQEQNPVAAVTQAEF